MARKAIDSVELLLRLEKQKMDQLRLEVFKLEEQLSSTLKAIDSLNQKIRDERELNSTKIETGQSYSSFSEISKMRQEEYRLQINQLMRAYNDLSKKLLDKFSDSKAYETILDHWKMLIKKEEDHFEQMVLDDIALRRKK